MSYEEKPLLKKVITIASAEKKTTKTGGEYFTVIDSNKMKFKVWKSKQDGTNTKAWDGLQALGLGVIGSTVAVAYTEEEKEFLGDKGQVKFMDRTVKFFEATDTPSAAIHRRAITSLTSLSSLNRRLMKR